MNDTREIIAAVCLAARALMWTVIAAASWIVVLVDEHIPGSDTWGAISYLIRFIGALLSTIAAFGYMRSVGRIERAVVPKEKR